MLDHVSVFEMNVRETAITDMMTSRIIAKTSATPFSPDFEVFIGPPANSRQQGGNSRRHRLNSACDRSARQFPPLKYVTGRDVQQSLGFLLVLFRLGIL